jgi:hypothetical protein
MPYAPLSHPFVERLIGTIRRECLDRTLFWTAADLETKLSISDVITIGIERVPGWTGARRNRALTPAAHVRVSVCFVRESNLAGIRIRPG